MRLTVKFIVKVGLFLLTLIFVGPFLMKYIFPKAVKHKENTVINPQVGWNGAQFVQLLKPAPDDELKAVVADSGLYPEKKVHGSVLQLKEPDVDEPFPSKIYGPKAVFKENEWGNFEPQLVNKKSVGDVIIFLDAHCECQKNWLPPLLARIAYDRTIMAVPIVDGINWDNFRYTSTYSSIHHRGIFEWGFLYKESQVPESVLKKRQHSSEPYWSPTHAGGLFAMDRKYFFELGGYDPGMKIWGGENFELSFKIWQCGGSVEWVPCSRVGHVYRNHMPYGFGRKNQNKPIVLTNYKRVVEVWLDPEYKEYFYTREPTIRNYPIGDISQQLKFKKDNKCKSFKWFIENIAPEVLERFPIPPPNQAWGEIKLKNGYKCWDTMGAQMGGRIGASQCHHYGGNQLYRLNVKGQIATGERCIIASGSQIIYTFCDVMPTGDWQYDKEKLSIYNKAVGKCVQSEGSSLLFKPCHPSKLEQQFIINELKIWPN